MTITKVAIAVGTATRQYNATNINRLGTHAINTKSMVPLCSDKLNVLTYAEYEKATPDNITCRNCLRKLGAIEGRAA